MATAPIVEIAWATEPLDPDPVWTDVTRYVRVADGITIRRGAADELEDIQAATLSLTLDNSDGRFTPGNAASPYWPNVLKNRRMRVRQAYIVANYCHNGGFESDVSTWSGSGAAAPTPAASAVRAHEGTQSMRITWATGGTTNAVGSTLYGLDIGATYTASAWVWVTAGTPAVRLGISGIGTGASSTTTAAWEQVSYTFAATATTHDLQVTPATATTSGQQAWIDEVMVTAGAAIGTYDATAPVISPRYSGFLNRLPVTWPGGARVSRTPITATCLFKPLARRQVRSLLEEELLADRPQAYYPLSEPSGSTSAGDLSGTVGGPLTITQAGSGGELAFAGATGPPADGLSAPLFTPLSSTSGVYLAADVGPDFAAASSNQFVHVSCWFSTTGTGSAMLSLRSLIGDYAISFHLASGTGQLQVAYTARTATNAITNTTVTWPTANLADGQVHHLHYNEFSGEVWIDGVSQGVMTTRLMFRLRLLTVGCSSFLQGLWAGGVSHVAVYAVPSSTSLTAARVLDHYDAGNTGLSGEAADDRVARIADYAGVIVASVGTLFDPVASQGAGGKAALAMLQEVSRSESGRLFSARDDGVVFQSRDLRYGRASSLTLDAADLDPPVYSDDDQYLVNRVEAGRPGGATVRVDDSDSQARYFTYGKTLALLKTSDAAVVDAAQWAINRYADPAPRVQSLTVEGSTLDTSTYRALLELEISDVVTVTNLPSQAPATTEVLTIEGWEEVIGEQWHTWRFLTSPATSDQVWQLDSADYSQLDDTTRLAY